MYQIKALCGFEIQVRGDLCTIVDKHNRTMYGGTYDACVAWLTARACWPTPNPRSEGETTMNTTIDTITDGQIRDLQREAANAGNYAQVSLCRMACGDEETATQTQIQSAREECVRVIRENEAQS